MGKSSLLKKSYRHFLFKFEKEDLLITYSCFDYLMKIIQRTEQEVGDNGILKNLFRQNLVSFMDSHVGYLSQGHAKPYYAL